VGVLLFSENVTFTQKKMYLNKSSLMSMSRAKSVAYPWHTHSAMLWHYQPRDEGEKASHE